MTTLPDIPQNYLRTEENRVGTFYFYPTLVIGILNEGITLDIETTQVLVAMSERNFGLNDFVYISIRVNSYSVDPTIYPHLTEMKNLKGIALVTGNTRYGQLYEVEKQFYSENMRIFNNLDDAILWSENLIE